MMGRQSGDQAELFYAFNLDKHIPEHHLLRSIDRVLDFSELRSHLSSYYSHTGRPSIDPELMVRMLLVGYCYGIRSERRLCEEVHLNLAYRWFCRLGLQDELPDHSTFSKNRHGRFRDSDAFRFLFEKIVRQCIEADLVAGEGFAADGSLIAADANRQRAVAGTEAVDWHDPKHSTRAVREYVEALEATNPVEPPKSISLTDPSARWTAREGPAFFAYYDNYLIDLKAGIILDVQVSAPTHSAESQAAKDMIERVEKQFDLKPQRFVADTAYGSDTMIGWLVDDKGIAPHIPVWDRAKRVDGTFNRAEFVFEAEHDRYVCPAGKHLKSSWRVRKKDPQNYRASQADCSACPLKQQCCPNSPHRRIQRRPHEAARDIARALAKTDAYAQSRKDRKKVEMLFAHLKRILKLDRLRLRGPSSAQDEFTLAALTQNLRRLAMWAKPPPEPIAT
jgi:transposase